MPRGSVIHNPFPPRNKRKLLSCFEFAGSQMELKGIYLKTFVAQVEPERADVHVVARTLISHVSYKRLC